MPPGRRLIQTIAMRGGSDYAHGVGAYALVEIGDPEAIDLFLREDDAERALKDSLRDEPQWQGVLRVEPIELDGRDVSPS